MDKKKHFPAFLAFYLNIFVYLCLQVISEKEI